MGVKTRPEVSIWVAPPDPLRQTSRWMPPAVNFLTIYFDGAWQLNSFKAGLGVIVRNEEGLFCGGLATPFHCSAALVAEAAAGLCAIKYAISRGLCECSFLRMFVFLCYVFSVIISRSQLGVRNL